MKRFVFLCLLVVVFASCAKNNVVECSVQDAAFGAPRALMAKSAATNSALSVDSEIFSEVSESAFERKLIKNGNISVEVQNLQKAEDSVSSWSKSFGGYIESSNVNPTSCSFTVKIPSGKFDEAMEAAGKFGSLKNRSVSVQDVSEQYYDLKGRLETRKLLRDKLSGYLKQATSMQDMLKIERELNSVQSEIESMEGRMNRLSNQIEYSTIEVFVSLPYNTTEGGFKFPDLGDGVRHFFANVLIFFTMLVTAIFYAIICGVPLCAVLALLYWVLFGKIGIIRKIINKLKN